jgi:hypothetical protein
MTTLEERDRRNKDVRCYHCWGYGWNGYVSLTPYSRRICLRCVGTGVLPVPYCELE